MIVDQALVRRLASLVRLELTEDEQAHIASDLDRVLGYVAILDELDLQDAPPLASVAGAGAASGLRPDEPRPSLSPELALREAPRTAEQGFAVPKFVDEG
ncbi:MAG: Asp-tRNA(Asn)/Glu-tRNA(Gln) amidotransferase subunit GatC [Myxococcales bacterium]|jgi:aspartyl-tRNA(Asn)/glutamyl-tRNA(Gln) amidotransferase subunit C|nr:Asp-tRNA(Asn)/Glu-tRNA(Gln) amidotransferase subunit GatC [Myxococcales bacterium]